MKTIEEIKKISGVSRTVIYKRISRLEKIDIKYKNKKRIFSDDEVEKIINGANPIGRPKKIYTEG